ncbi:hypothetical protein [Paenibacillus whitsoniae]|uniref:Pectate lyase superfamily protein domain-containing protein n=1 Tax=Paenibacillus whitsoniae TaxID=2496558 RepID=A0A430JAP7_9BACL|nr:hypothetical protein [Paenibacillus whitsoniae]RTE08113.1 hypothetical protein EJQ19_18640 [Paenibacillus whitsoniae]
MPFVMSSIADLKKMTAPDVNSLYYVTDSGRDGFFRYDPTDTTSANNDATIIVSASRGRFKRTMMDDGVNVQWFGAKGDGSDASDAFIAALRFAESMVKNHRGKVKLLIPSGTYSISKSEALLGGTYTNSAVGYVIQGAGKGVTQIAYTNQAASNNYLLYNNDAWQHIHIQDIEFTGSSPNAIFMYSYAANSAQNYTFERCMWNGTWKNVFQLEGGNLNSEMTWFHCNFNGSMENAIYVPYSTNKSVEPNTMAIRSGGSDQFLNYNLFACQFEVTKGNYLNFQYGGNINVWGGSLIHIGTGTGANGVPTGPGGTFFKLGKTNYLQNGSYNNPDPGHAGGAVRFLCIGPRIEHRVQTSKLIECNWYDGSITFLSVDNASMDFSVPSYVNALFDVSNGTPTVKFDGCRLAGKHSFLVNYGSYNHNNDKIVYENTRFTQAAKADDFLAIVDNTNGYSLGGRPPVTFRNCSGSGSTSADAFFDSDQNYLLANRSQLTTKMVSIRNVTGKLPAAGQVEAFDLPLNALILNVIFFSPAGAVTSKNAATYTIQTTDKTPVVVATYTSANMSLGYRQTVSPLFYCDTEERRNLQLVPGSTVNVENPKGVILIEYIG